MTRECKKKDISFLNTFIQTHEKLVHNKYLFYSIVCYIMKGQKHCTKNILVVKGILADLFLDY